MWVIPCTVVIRELCSYYSPVTSGNAAPKKWPMMVNQWMPDFGHLKMFVVGRLGSAHDFFAQDFFFVLFNGRFSPPLSIDFPCTFCWDLINIHWSTLSHILGFGFIVPVVTWEHPIFCNGMVGALSVTGLRVSRVRPGWWSYAPWLCMALSCMWKVDSFRGMCCWCWGSLLILDGGMNSFFSLMFIVSRILLELLCQRIG